MKMIAKSKALIINHFLFKLILIISLALSFTL